MTLNLAALTLHEPCTASDSVIIGDGSGLSISNIASFSLTSLLTPLLFSNVLHVPTMSKNLISVLALCVDSLINVLFFDSFFQVQDRHMGVPLVRGQHRDDVYYWPMLVPLSSSALVLSFLVWSLLSIIFMWHSCLSHPSLPIFHKFLSVLSISFPDKYLCSFSCKSCNINKSHKLLFATSSITSSSPLKIIFSNVWTSLVASSDGVHYYVIFVNHYTKYNWFYPLHHKSNVHSTFVAFKNIVENYFTTTITTLYTNNGGKFLAFRSFLATHGISHFTTLPHTLEHNEYFERRHQHIVETGFTLLHQASGHMPLLWLFI